MNKIKCVEIDFERIKDIGYEKENLSFTLGKVYECEKVSNGRINIKTDSGEWWHNKRIDGVIYKMEILDERCNS